MRVYSAIIFKFLKKCEKILSQIVNDEMNLKYGRGYITLNGYKIPIKLIIFEKENILGEFDSRFSTIGLNRSLLLSSSDEMITNTLRHELAHFYCYHCRNKNLRHDSTFRQVCQDFGWDKNVYAAKEKSDLSSSNNKIVSKELISKLQKLWNLSRRGTEHEAKLAYQKLNNILVEHHLNSDILSADKEEFYEHSAIVFKKNTGKIQAIYHLLEFFHVKPVYIYTNEIKSINVIGTKNHIEIACYVADFLQTELERLYQLAINQNEIANGISSKNSFMLGIAMGYQKNFIKMEKTFPREVQKQLIIIKNKLDVHCGQIYPHLGQSTRGVKRNLHSEFVGIQHGKNLTIREGLSSGKQKLIENRL